MTVRTTTHSAESTTKPSATTRGNSADRNAGTERSRPEPDDRGEQEERALLSIRDALRGLSFGQITVVVHDGAVVQVDRTEKIRVRP